MGKQLYLCLKVHLLSFLRNRGAFFWTLTFPLFLYLVFYSIFRNFNDESYAIYLLSGVLGMTVTADGLFGVGQVIKQAYSSGTIRLLKKMPVGILVYFAGMVLNRFLIISVLLGVLNVACFIITGAGMPFSQISAVCAGVLLGLWIFSFLGLSLFFMDIRSHADKGIINIVYFFVLFTSNSFYQLGMFNEDIAFFANYLPLNAVLAIMRMEIFNPWVLIFWMIVPVLTFYLLYSKIQYAR